MSVGLDNPIWASLETIHDHLATGGDRCKRYPPSYAPFVGVAGASAEDVRALVSLGETLFLLGTDFDFGPHLVVESVFEIQQFTWCRDREIPPDEATDFQVERLGPQHTDEIFEFASRYYPQFFRRQTAELGTFFGLREAGRLIAISGERLGTPECAEMSTVVVAPSHAGRGIGRQLARSSVLEMIQGHRTPFLHILTGNARAIDLVTRAGFTPRRTFHLWMFKRIS